MGMIDMIVGAVAAIGGGVGGGLLSGWWTGWLATSMICGESCWV
jgi:hypothetical protein